MVAGPSGVRVARQASRSCSRSEAPCPIGAIVRARSSGLLSSNLVRVGVSNVSRDYRNLEGERAAFALRRVDFDVPVVHPGDLARKPQAQPRARNMHGRLRMDPTEFCEQPRLVLGSDAD